MPEAGRRPPLFLLVGRQALLLLRARRGVRVTADPMPGALAGYTFAEPRVLAAGVRYALDQRRLGLADARLRVLQDRLERQARVPLHTRLARLADEVAGLSAREQEAQRLLVEQEYE